MSAPALGATPTVARSGEGPAVRWRPSTAIAVGLGGLAIVLAFLLRDSAAFLFATPLLLAPLAASFLRPRQHTAVAAEGRGRRPDGSPALGFWIQVAPPPAGYFESDVALRPPLTVGGERPRRWRADALGRGSVEFPISTSWPYLETVEPPSVTWNDPLGLASMALPVRGSPVRIEQGPAETRRIGNLIVERTARTSGARFAPPPARTGEFQTVRLYQAGDSVRQINWNATARRSRLVSNSYQAEVPVELVLALDVGPWGLPEVGDQALLGIMRAAATSLATQLFREKARLGAALLDPFPRCVRVGTGAVHRMHVRQLLASASLARFRPPVDRYAHSLERIYPPRTTVLLLSPLVDEGMLSIGYRLRRVGLNSLVVSPSPLTIERARVPASDLAASFGFRLLRLRRTRDISQAWQWGPVIDWEEFSSLAALSALFRRPLKAGGVGRG